MHVGCVQDLAAVDATSVFVIHQRILSRFDAANKADHEQTENKLGAIVILGATGTIGSHVARRLVRNRQDVLLVGRNPEKLAALSEELSQPWVLVDMSHSSNLEEALQACADRTGGYSGFVNCIGSLWLKPVQVTSDLEFRAVLETNLFTAFATIRAAGSWLKEHGGSVVLFASAAAEIGIANHEAIAAAKAGIIGMARSAAASFGARNIRVNVVSPGLVRTEMTRRIWSQPASEQVSRQMHALGRLGEPEQVASLVTWLLDSENDWVTGQVMGVDGGLGHVLSRR